MTAPDDVRARFEAWAKREEYSLSRRPCDSYADYDTLNAWIGYRAAHADLSGEVRELVEVVRELADDLREWGATDFQLAMRAARLDTALAKFHHTQRATNYVSGHVDDAGKFHPTHQENEHGA